MYAVIFRATVGELDQQYTEAIERMDANADFIVTACNSHYDLMDRITASRAENKRMREALERADDALEELINRYASRTFINSIVAMDEQYPWIAKAMKARAALKKAGAA